VIIQLPSSYQVIIQLVASCQWNWMITWW
jgi:hypothetical protein